MEKSVNLIINDLQKQLVDTVNSYSLPISITNLIVQEFARTVAESTKLATERDKQMYEEGMKNETKQEG